MECGMIFQDWCIQAIRSEPPQKTQTRRMRGLKEVNAKPECWRLANLNKNTGEAIFRHKAPDSITLHYKSTIEVKSYYGGIGDVIWTRENWRETGSEQQVGDKIPKYPIPEEAILYRADGHEYDGPWRPLKGKEVNNE